MKQQHNLITLSGSALLKKGNGSVRSVDIKSSIPGATISLYDGIDSSGITLLTLRPQSKEATINLNPRGIYFTEGLFIKIEGTAVISVWYN